MAQGTSERKVTVPLHDPSRPAQIRAQLNLGGITVRAYDGRDVLVQSGSRPNDGPRESEPERAHGMRRLDLPGNMGLDVIEEENVVTIKTGSWAHPGDLTITVPRKSSLQLKCLNDGNIDVDGVDGEIDADNLNGKVILKNVSGSVVAHSLNGEILVTMDRIDGSKPMSFSTLNGDIDVTLPPTVKANLRMKTDNGDIFSDFEVKLDSNAPVASSESGRQKDGKFRVRFDRTVRGTVNGGGPDYQFTSFNGQIYIRKKK
jgi:DUF4097 and DUF4098 domain-containing protein YvlB